MIYPCSEILGNGATCGKPAVGGQEYCRWHLNIRQLHEEAGAWRTVWAWFYCCLGSCCAVAALQSLWGFAGDPTVALLGSSSFSILASIWCLSMGIVLHDKRYAVCAQLLVGAFAGLACVSLLAGSSELAAISSGKEPSLYLDSLQRAPRAIRVPAEFVFGIYMLLGLLSHLGIASARLLQRIVITVFVCVWCCSMVFTDSPALDIAVS